MKRKRSVIIAHPPLTLRSAFRTARPRFSVAERELGSQLSTAFWAQNNIQKFIKNRNRQNEMGGRGNLVSVNFFDAIVIHSSIPAAVDAKGPVSLTSKPSASNYLRLLLSVSLPIASMDAFWKLDLANIWALGQELQLINLSQCWGKRKERGKMELQ